MRRVLLVITDTRRGGAPLRVSKLARALPDHGWEPAVVSLMPAGTVLDELGASGVAVSSLDMRSGRDLLRARKAFRETLRCWEPHLVQSFLWHANVLARLEGTRGRVPVVDAFESVDDAKPAARTFVDRVTHRRASWHVAVTDEAADRAATRERIPRRSISVIPPAVVVPQLPPRDDARRRLGLAEDARVVAFVGRLHEVKNIDVLIDAVGRLPEPWTLVIAGAGPRSEALAAQASRVLPGGRCRLVGEVRDVGPVLAAADVFALPSRWEGLPAALLEAMAAGLPVVATATGGIPAFVTHGRSGLLVPPGEVAALASALESALGRTDFGRHAAEVAAQFTVEAMTRRFVDVWERLLASR